MSDGSDLLQINAISSGRAFKITELGQLEPLAIPIKKKIGTVCRGSIASRLLRHDVELFSYFVTLDLEHPVRGESQAFHRTSLSRDAELISFPLLCETTALTTIQGKNRVVTNKQTKRTIIQTSAGEVPANFWTRTTALSKPRPPATPLSRIADHGPPSSWCKRFLDDSGHAITPTERWTPQERRYPALRKVPICRL
jgi:hypothetical protein